MTEEKPPRRAQTSTQRDQRSVHARRMADTFEASDTPTTAEMEAQAAPDGEIRDERSIPVDVLVVEDSRLTKVLHEVREQLKRLTERSEQMRDRAHHASNRIMEIQAVQVEIAERLDTLEGDRAEFESSATYREYCKMRHTAATGIDGRNGIFGTLRMELEALAKANSDERRERKEARWKLIAFVLGLVVLAATTIAGVSWKLATITSAIDQLRHQP